METVKEANEQIISDQDIIEAYKNCQIKGGLGCYNCPFDKDEDCSCLDDLREATFNLIQNQKAEIERLREIAQEPNANVREIAYAEWYYDPNGMDWGLGAWKCSKCHTKNDNLGMGNDINPYMFSGSKFCPQCGAVMKAKEVNENDR